MATTELIELAIETSKKAYVLFSLSLLELFCGKDGKCLYRSEYREC